ncbi:MAG: DUF488 family protein [Thermoplasmataceae archaeon]|jgi:uncharacterized protein YeaO (DUF488 family)
MEVKVKSIYEPKEPSDGIRVLITRYYPRGVKRENFDIWMRSLAPDQGLLKRYKEGSMTWSDFETEFYDEVKNRNQSIQDIEKIRSMTQEKNVTLLCFEKEGENCHRYLVQRIMKE